MVIIEQLSAEFKIKLSAELIDPFSNHIGLHFKVFFITEADFHAFLLTCVGSIVKTDAYDPLRYLSVNRDRFKRLIIQFNIF